MVVCDFQRMNIHALINQPFSHPLSILADSPRVRDTKSRTSQRDGLVESLAPGELLKRQTWPGFARLHEIMDLIDVVNIQRAEVQDVLLGFLRHLSVPSLLLLSPANGQPDSLSRFLCLF